VSVARLADAAAPGLLVAQGIGRFGNWWNQELFGKPTDLPWALEIDCATADCGEYFEATTFHPTFLYEALWCFGAALLLLAIERLVRLRPGSLFAIYVLVYSIGRLWIETLRIDPSHEWGGVRLNVYVAGAAILLSALFLVWWQRGWRRDPGPPKVETMAVPRGR
jgi:prolipoprotein diacylglyceryl transferase